MPKSHAKHVHVHVPNVKKYFQLVVLLTFTEKRL